MSAEVIEIGSDGGCTPIQDEGSEAPIILDALEVNARSSPILNDGRNTSISPIIVSDPDDDVPLVDLIEAGETPRESPSPDLSVTDVVPPEDVVPISIADEIALELKKRKSKPKKVLNKILSR